jgi:LuxR family maltose regulon positive regulatory protein
MEDFQGTLLLSTKLKIPVPRKNYIVRRGLFDQLSACADMSIIFIRGGAGTGKTTLLSSFLRETGLKNVCWMSLDASNGKVHSFWLYFTAAVSTFWGDDSLLALMQSNPDASHMEELLILLINRLCGEEDYYMVLDDVHCIKDAALVKTFEFFIGAMPPNFHFFMLSREEPPVYLGAMAVSGRLLYIDSKQMLLSLAEGMAFMKDTLKLAVGEEELNQLNAYAEGWIGGLQLAAAAKTSGIYSGQLLRSGGGIATEYLTREVLKTLSPEERDFLLKTGFLSYFDAGICKKLFEGFSDQAFRQRMEDLIQKNLFIICLDENMEIYRYHNILSEYLTQQFLHLEEEEKGELYLKSAKAFEQRGDYEEAMRTYLAAGAYQEILRVAHIVEGRIETWSYLNQVPIDLLMQDADLASQCLIYNLGNLDVERCRVIYNKFREYYKDTDLFHILQFVEAYIPNGGNILPKFYALSAEQIDRLQFGAISKAMILVGNAAALVEQMEYEEAEDCIKKAVRSCNGANIFVDSFAYNQLAQIYEETGRLNDSLLCYVKSREMFDSTVMLSGIGTNYYFGITGVYMRRMELDRAGEMLLQAKQLMENKHSQIDATDMTLAYHLAEMKFLSGDDAAGEVLVNGILSEYPAYSVLTLGRLLHELDCADKLSKELADKFVKELDVTPGYKHQPFMRLLRARLLFKRGEREEAMRETEEILTFSRLRGNKLRLVEAGLLKIYMLLPSGGGNAGQREISNLLREAVHYAKEDKILMPFYLDREVLLPLLVEAASQTTGKNALSSQELTFLHEAIAVCSPPQEAVNKQELLSARELEVLKELSLGITNREIAEKLCISQATVKTHIISIFGKLGVSSRMMAADKGRQEGLI